MFFFLVTSLHRTRNCAVDFEPCSRLGDLNLDVKKNTQDVDERDVLERFPKRYSTFFFCFFFFLLVAKLSVSL